MTEISELSLQAHPPSYRYFLHVLCPHANRNVPAQTGQRKISLFRYDPIAITYAFITNNNQNKNNKYGTEKENKLLFFVVVQLLNSLLVSDVVVGVCVCDQSALTKYSRFHFLPGCLRGFFIPFYPVFFFFSSRTGREALLFLLLYVSFVIVSLSLLDFLFRKETPSDRRCDWWSISAAPAAQ